MTGVLGPGADARVKVDVRLSDVPQFRLLVAFAGQVEQYAMNAGDEDLKQLVDDTRDKLLAENRKGGRGR